MPSKKKKYNARFPAGRIKKIMQSDEEVGKVAQAVPVIIFFIDFFCCLQYIPRTLELFVESLLTKTLKITNSRNAKTISPSHMKQCIMAENQFDFLRELVKNIPDISVNEEYCNLNDGSLPVSPCLESPPPPSTAPMQPHTPLTPIQQEPYDLSKPSTSCEFNFTRNLVTSPHKQLQQQQQQVIGIKISNGQSSPLIRNGNNISNNLQQQQVLMGFGKATSATASSSSLSSSSSSSSSQGIEISCKNSLIAKISIPTLSATNDNSVAGIVTPDIALQSNLKRSWDSMSRLRQQSLPTPSGASANTTLTSPTNSNNKKNSESIEKMLPSPAKLSRLDSISNIQHQQQNITITPIKLPTTNTASTTNNSTISSKEKKNHPQTPSTDFTILQQKQHILTPEPIVSIDRNDYDKPIVKLDYSNFSLLQQQPPPPPTPNDSKNTYCPLIANNNNTKLRKKSATPTTTTITTPEILSSPVINIDLSKIGTQPPTINFNFNNLITTDNNSIKQTKPSSSSHNQPPPSTSVAAMTVMTTPSTTLELDEDYDNI